MENAQSIVQNIQAMPKLSTIQFFGKCQNCEREINITPFIDVGTKIKYVQINGIVFKGSVAVCKFIPPLGCCPACVEI